MFLYFLELSFHTFLSFQHASGSDLALLLVDIYEASDSQVTDDAIGNTCITLLFNILSTNKCFCIFYHSF